MKKLLFDLQLFADEVAGTQPEAGTEPGNATNENKPGTEQPKGSATDEKKYTDADLDKIISKKFAEMQQKQEKKIAEAAKLAEMNAQQKAEYQRDELQKELDEYKRKDTLAEMSKTARKMLSDEGVNIPDDLLAVLVTPEAEGTKTAVESFAKLFKSAVEDAVKEKLRGEPPKRGSGAGGVAAMTKEQIMNIKDPEARQKAMLENKHLFNF